jgi:hypothetical protein
LCYYIENNYEKARPKCGAFLFGCCLLIFLQAYVCFPIPLCSSIKINNLPFLNTRLELNGILHTGGVKMAAFGIIFVFMPLSHYCQ